MGEQGDGGCRPPCPSNLPGRRKFHPCPLTFGRWFGISAAAMTITDRRSFVPGDSPLTAPILSPGLVSVVYVGYLLFGRCFSSSAFPTFPREPFYPLVPTE